MRRRREKVQKWLEHPVSAEQAAEGTVRIQALNARKGSNAVISIIEGLQK